MGSRNSTKPLVCGYYTDWNRHDGTEGYGGVGWYRIINPLAKLGYETVGKFTIGGAQNAVDMGEKGHIWYMKPSDSSGMALLIGTAKEMTGSKLIIDLDDDPINFDDTHPLYKELKEKSERVMQLIKMADHIVVSTEPLKRVVSKYNKNISVIPNAIDRDIWQVKKKKSKDIHIGWIASGSHMTDMPLILPVIKEILDKYDNVRFTIAGVIASDLEGYKGKVRHVAGTAGYQDYPQFLADLGLDIAIAPLINTQFNMSKSNIKWLESSMLKIPMVLSDMYPYQCVEHGKTGFLAVNHKDWVKYLSRLIESEDLRKEIGENAYKEMENYTVDKVLPLYKDVFEKVREKNITVYTSLIGKYDKLPEKEYKGANQIAFTDQKATHWTVREPYTRFTDQTRNSRIQKIMPHHFIDTEYSIYLDANIELLVEPQVLIDEYLKYKDIAVFNHIGRQCVYDEADACVQLGKEDPKILAEQIKSYAKQGYPQQNGLMECGVIIRRHTERINDLNEKWWAHYCRYGRRDQLSFPVVFPKDEVQLIYPTVSDHKYFSYKHHEKH